MVQKLIVMNVQKFQLDKMKEARQLCKINSITELKMISMLLLIKTLSIQPTKRRYSTVVLSNENHLNSEMIIELAHETLPLHLAEVLSSSSTIKQLSSN